MRVAVCDDDRRFCYKMKDILEQYEEIRGIHMETDLFFDGNELCGRLETGQRYHLIFLDVLMKKLNGVETGKFIRRVIDDYDTRIIYVSCDKEYAIELIQNQPTNFLKKPVGARQIFQNLDAIQRRDRKEQNQFFYRQGKLVHEIPYSEIVYYQSMGRKIQIHTPKQVYEYNGKLSQLLKEGLPSNFICIHKSYIINRDYVMRRMYDKIYLKDTEEWLPVSQKYRKQVRESLKKSIIHTFGGPTGKSYAGFSTNYDRETDEFCI